MRSILPSDPPPIPYISQIAFTELPFILPICKNCHYSCLTCSNSLVNNCLSCETNDFRISNPNQNSECPCINRYRKIKIAIFFDFLIGTTMSVPRPVTAVIIPVSLVTGTRHLPAYLVNLTISESIHRLITSVHAL